MSGPLIAVVSICGIIIIGGGIAAYALKPKSEDNKGTPTGRQKDKGTTSKKTNKSGPLFKCLTFAVGAFLLALGVGLLVSTTKYIWDIINPPPSGRKGGVGYNRVIGRTEGRPSPYGSSIQPPNPEVEKKARDFFQESKYNFTPGQVDELVDICVRESGCNQVDAEGHPLRGIPPEGNPKDVGAMQINEDYWLERSRDDGFDIYTLEGNLGFAAELYNEQGAKPWVNSEKNSRLNAGIRASNAQLTANKSKELKDVTAPLTKWKRVYVNGGRFSVVADGDIYIRTNTVPAVLFKKNGKVELGDNIMWLEFQSAEDEEVIVHVTT